MSQADTLKPPDEDGDIEATFKRNPVITLFPIITDLCETRLKTCCPGFLGSVLKCTSIKIRLMWLYYDSANYQKLLNVRSYNSAVSAHTSSCLLPQDNFVQLSRTVLPCKKALTSINSINVS